MIGDLDPCSRCGERPKRLAIDDRADGRWYRLMRRGSLWWQLIVSDQDPGPAAAEPIATRRDLLRSQAAILRLADRVTELEERR